MNFKLYLLTVFCQPLVNKYSCTQQRLIITKIPDMLFIPMLGAVFFCKILFHHTHIKGVRRCAAHFKMLCDCWKKCFAYSKNLMCERTIYVYERIRNEGWFIIYIYMVKIFNPISFIYQICVIFVKLTMYYWMVDARINYQFAGCVCARCTTKSIKHEHINELIGGGIYA